MLKKPEPVMISAIAALVVNMLARHGVAIESTIVVDAINVAFVIGAALWARSKVTPVTVAP